MQSVDSNKHSSSWQNVAKKKTNSESKSRIVVEYYLFNQIAVYFPIAYLFEQLVVLSSHLELFTNRTDVRKPE